MFFTATACDKLVPAMISVMFLPDTMMTVLPDMVMFCAARGTNGLSLGRGGQPPMVSAIFLA